MDNDNLEQIVNGLIDARLSELGLSSLNTPFHKHTGTDGSPQLEGKAIIGAPQSITSFPTGSLSTGGTAVLSASDSAILTSLIASNVSIYQALQKLGILK